MVLSCKNVFFNFSLRKEVYVDSPYIFFAMLILALGPALGVWGVFSLCMQHRMSSEHVLDDVFRDVGFLTWVLVVGLYVSVPALRVGLIVCSVLCLVLVLGFCVRMFLRVLSDDPTLDVHTRPSGKKK